jgi:hypothetical protein
MAQNMINPDLIQEGDQVTLASANGIQSVWQVTSRKPTRLIVEDGCGSLENVPLSGRRSRFTIVAHQPRLV